MLFSPSFHSPSTTFTVWSWFSMYRWKGSDVGSCLACARLFFSLYACFCLSTSLAELYCYFFFSFLFAGSETQNTGYGEYYIHRVAVYANTAKQNRPEDVFELLRTLQTPLTAESASARLRRPTPLMRRPTASWLGRRPRQWRHRRATALSLVAHRILVPRGTQRVAVPRRS